MADPPSSDAGYPANSCQFCHTATPDWHLMRYGDAVVSWACDSHLVFVLDALQRPTDPRTEISVTRSVLRP